MTQLDEGSPSGADVPATTAAPFNMFCSLEPRYTGASQAIESTVNTPTGNPARPVLAND